MKVFGPYTRLPEPDYRNYDWREESKKEKAHQEMEAAELRRQGFTGPNTGRILQIPVADGHAIYMYADNGAKSILIHLPYGDGYQSRDVEFLPRKEVLARIEQRERITALFNK